MKTMLKTMDELATKAAEIAYPIFQANGWTWFGSPNPPTVDELDGHIYHLLRTAENGNYENVSSGRILVLRINDNPQNPSFEVFVEIEHSHDG